MVFSNCLRKNFGISEVEIEAEVLRCVFVLFSDSNLRSTSWRATEVACLIRRDLLSDARHWNRTVGSTKMFAVSLVVRLNILPADIENYVRTADFHSDRRILWFQT